MIIAMHIYIYIYIYIYIRISGTITITGGPDDAIDENKRIDKK